MSCARIGAGEEESTGRRRPRKRAFSSSGMALVDASSLGDHPLVILFFR